MAITLSNQPRLRQGLRVAAYGLGSLTIALAVTAYLTDASLASIFDWLRRVFTPGFIVIYLVLVATALHAAWRLGQGQGGRFWREVGLQAAGGIATLALTFTLLGISLGIGSLADQSITPQTIQQIIQGLTRHFSMAFMTTVVGLPTAALLRALIALKVARHPMAANR